MVDMTGGEVSIPGGGVRAVRGLSTGLVASGHTAMSKHTIPQGLVHQYERKEMQEMQERERRLTLVAEQQQQQQQQQQHQEEEEDEVTAVSDGDGDETAIVNLIVAQERELEQDRSELAELRLKVQQQEQQLGERKHSTAKEQLQRSSLVLQLMQSGQHIGTGMVQSGRLDQLQHTARRRSSAAGSAGLGRRTSAGAGTRAMIAEAEMLMHDGSGSEREVCLHTHHITKSKRAVVCRCRCHCRCRCRCCHPHHLRLPPHHLYRFCQPVQLLCQRILCAFNTSSAIEREQIADASRASVERMECDDVLPKELDGRGVITVVDGEGVVLHDIQQEGSDLLLRQVPSCCQTSTQAVDDG